MGKIFDFITLYKEKYAKDIMVAGRDSNGDWKTYSTKEYTEAIDTLSRALLKLDLKKGDRVGIMSGNRPEWNLVDFACNQIGLATVPLYPTLSAQDLSFIVNDSDVKVLFVSSKELTDRIEQAIREHGIQPRVYTFDRIEHHITLADLIASATEDKTDLSSHRDNVNEEDLLTLIYTSGTTGRPKGVYLSHKNVYSNVTACNYLIREDFKTALSFLPLCHIFERMVVYMYYSKGIKIYFSENLDNVVADINDVKPDVFTTVPRVLEKVYDKIIEKGKALTGIKKKLFFWAVDLGLKFQEPEKNGVFYNFKLGIARKLIFSKWQEALGGNIKIIVSGGAALQERLARIFWAADLKVLEGYGLTETSPVIAVNSYLPNGLKFGTVGKPLKNLDVKIASDGEILVKGPSITTGYYKNEEATRDAFDGDVFFKTGDIGEITSDGFLKITDRKKEMFKTAGGKYIAPQSIENKLMESTLIGQVMVIGENRKFPSALIVPAFDVLSKWATQKGISASTNEEIIKNSEVIQKYQEEINRLSANFGHWEVIKKFILLPKEWTISEGQLTPKLSLKRKIILKENEVAIDRLYMDQHQE